jgi:hypothetical protein
MRQISLVSWRGLPEEQQESLRKRRNEPIHMVEHGANVFEKETYPDQVFAVVENKSGRHIGIVRWSPPLDRASAAWWIDPEFRDLKLGKQAVKLLAERMLKEGVTGLDALGNEPTSAHQNGPIKCAEVCATVLQFAT